MALVVLGGCSDRSHDGSNAEHRAADFGGDAYNTHPGPPVGATVDATPTPTPTETTVPRALVAEDTPAPSPQAAQEEAPGLYQIYPEGCTQEIICAYDWDCATAMRVVDCETGGTFSPFIVGKKGERGCFQIHPIHWGKPQCSGDLFNPAYNTACAYSIWAAQGWGPWSCY